MTLFQYFKQKDGLLELSSAISLDAIALMNKEVRKVVSIRSREVKRTPYNRLAK